MIFWGLSVAHVVAAILQTCHYLTCVNSYSAAVLAPTAMCTGAFLFESVIAWGIYSKRKEIASLCNSLVNFEARHNGNNFE